VVEKKAGYCFADTGGRTGNDDGLCFHDVRSVTVFFER